MFDVTSSMEAFMSNVDKRMNTMESEVIELMKTAESCGLPIKQYYLLPLNIRAAAIRKDITRAKASATGGE